MAKALYVMIGGFLGAGKTTAVLQFARRFRAEGKRAGLITNDQSFGLVDTAMLSSQGFDVEEITGGCFCCRFNTLVEAAQNLSRDTRPDAFIAEPVGSCTDLRAAVSYPLRKIYGDDFEVAPLSVLIDPVRAERILGLAEGRAFSPKVLYVYGKQLEEADAIVINKSDLLDAPRLDRLRAALADRYPLARLFTVSARTGEGLDEWFDYILASATSSREAPEVDYETYAEGEALLGWLNCTVQLDAPAEFDGNAFLESVASHLRVSIGTAEIAHLKMTMSPDSGNDIAVLNLVRTDGTPEFSHRLAAPVASAELLLNFRAEADPEQLWLQARAALGAAAAEFSANAEVREHEFFPAVETYSDAPDGYGMSAPRIVYCNCSFARVLAPEVKGRVLDGLASSGVEFDAIPDLCEMSARKDPALTQIAQGEVTIAACYPRAVRWLFSAAGAPLVSDQTRILNMRTDSAESVLASLLASNGDAA